MSDYVVISPCRNEQDFMLNTLNSVICQTIKPKKWVIVDDGSTDETPEILKSYSAKYDFIEIVTRDNRGHRSVGPGVIEAFYDGLSKIELNDYSYVCKLDLDLILPERYFEVMIEKIEQDPRLGTYSGKLYYTDKASGKYVSEGCGDESSIGPAKFYRISCFKQIGGFVRQVMWDGIDSHRCRYFGWKSQSFDEEAMRCTHLRPMGSSQKGILTGRMRHGYGQYFMGTGLVYMLAATIYRLSKRPFIIGGLAMLWGYLTSAINRAGRMNDPKLKKFINRYQWSCLLRGKKKATEMLDFEQAQKWDPSVKGYDIPI
jgi:biofilm PGA synthesis N-glycosyltransferase PgaC